MDWSRSARGGVIGWAASTDVTFATNHRTGIAEAYAYKRAVGANGLVFDMDGVKAENRLLLTGFGGRFQPRFQVARTSASLQVARLAKSTAKDWFGRYTNSA
jgi:hypothetical protein